MIGSDSGRGYAVPFFNKFSDDLLKEFFFALKVIVYGSLGYSSGFGNLIHTGVLIAFFFRKIFKRPCRHW